MAKRLAVPAQLQHLVEKRDNTRRVGDRRKSSTESSTTAAEKRKSPRRKTGDRRG